MAITANVACDYIFAKKRMAGGKLRGEMTISIREFADFLICTSRISEGAFAITGSLPSVVDVDPLSYRFADDTLFLMSPDSEEDPDEVIQSVEHEIELQQEGLAGAMAMAFDQVFATVASDVVTTNDATAGESVMQGTMDAQSTPDPTDILDDTVSRECREAVRQFSQEPWDAETTEFLSGSLVVPDGNKEGRDAMSDLPCLSDMLDNDWAPVALRARRTGRGVEIAGPTRKELGLLKSLRAMLSMLERNGEIETVPISVTDDLGNQHKAYASDIYLFPGTIMMRYESRNQVNGTVQTVSVPFSSISTISIVEPREPSLGDDIM